MKKRTHYLMVRVVFERPVEPDTAARLTRTLAPLDLLVREGKHWPSVGMRITSVRPLNTAGPIWTAGHRARWSYE